MVGAADRCGFTSLEWNHADEAHVAFVPALGIEVAATKPEELDKLIPEHIRFALRRTKARRRRCTGSRCSTA